MATTSNKVTRWSQEDVGRVRTRVDAEFSRMSDGLPELRMSVLSTSDGRALAGRFSQGGNKDRAAAIISSVLAICETAGKEFATGRCSSAILTAEQANVVAQRVGASSSPFVLAIALDSTVMLGTALRVTADLAERIASIIAEETRVN